ncbi:RNA ligase family protein [Salinibaculum rarum]|uniref:RNA ligase family protein n=1 Tax=Salinibaculum rarum TaxID=3058903 RepID=UPI0034E93523
MKVYPKIPRYDHPVVPEDYFETDDLVLVEKFDGSSFRFTLYDERYADAYPNLVTEHADGDGSLVFGTRKSIRGSHRDDLSEIDGALHRAVRCLREGVDTESLRTLHNEYGCPLVVYAENMVYSTLDYGYTERAIPALIGFDVLPCDAIEHINPHGNPYEETHAGFLDIDAVQTILDRIRLADAPREHALVPATILEQPGSTFDPKNYEFPTSSLADETRVEGVIVRSDSRERRVKVVREAFEELNREQFGTRPEEANSGAAYVVATYCTPGRIRKQVREMVIEENREFGLHLNDDLHERVVEDIWAENWQELMGLDRSFTPSEMYPLVAKRCITELRKMETNAELNDADPTDIWRHLS